MEEQTICPWCSSEIIWDEELGPEDFCPHCDNELGNYRTMPLTDEPDDDNNLEHEEEEAKKQQQLTDEDLWDEDELSTSSANEWTSDNGFRSGNRHSLAMDHNVQRVVDEQEDVPECPHCREYMIEAGRQSIGGGADYEPTVSPVLKDSVLGSPFKIIWYVCPSCFHTSSQLAAEERLKLIQKLSAENL